MAENYVHLSVIVQFFAGVISPGSISCEQDLKSRIPATLRRVSAGHRQTPRFLPEPELLVRIMYHRQAVWFTFHIRASRTSSFVFVNIHYWDYQGHSILFGYLHQNLIGISHTRV